MNNWIYYDILQQNTLSDSSTMTISGGTFTFENVATRGTYDLIRSAKGILKITGGTFINLNTSNKCTANVIDNGAKSTFTMTGGTLKASGPTGYALDNGGTAKLKGGSLSSEQPYKVYV